MLRTDIQELQVRKALDLSICIVNYNTRDTLRSCLQSIYNNTKAINFEVIVVDNGSRDRSPEMLEEDFTQVKLIRNDRNLYFTKANNQAIKSSSGRYVLILNSDTIVLEDTLKKMVGFMDKNPNVGAATCQIKGSDGQMHQSCWRRLSSFDILKSRWPLARLFPWLGFVRGYTFDSRFSEQCYNVDVVVDAFLLARKKALDQVEGYDERFLLYCTEDDICLRIRQRGWKVCFYGGATILHQRNVSTRKMHPIRKQKIIKWDTVAYFRKYHSLFSAFIVNVAMTLELTLFLSRNSIKKLISWIF